MAENSDIQEVSNALASFDKVAAGLAVLTKQYGGVVYDVQTPRGMAAAKEARVAIRNPRYEIERIRKAAKAPLLAIGKRLDSEAARITTELMGIEDPIDQQIKNEEGRKERERAEAEAKEAARLAAIQERIDAIRRLPLLAAGKTAEHAAAVLEQAMATDVHGLGAAGDEALSTAVYAIKGVIAEREAHEAEQARIAAERAELAKLREAEQARLAEQDRIAREQAEAARKELAQQQEAARLAREVADREAAAERKRLDDEAKAERDRQQALIDAENRRIADERAKQAAEQARLAAAARAQNRPSDEQILRVLADHYEVSTDVVRQWLSTLDLVAAA
jgi:colicin import membrane protein